MAICLRFSPRRAVARGLTAMVLSAGILAGVTPSMADDTWPDEVRAKYKVHFGGFQIGEFRLNSTVKGNTYELKSSAELSVLMGAWKWKGSTHASGTVAGNAATPEAYDFNYKSKKTGKVHLGFTGRKVTQVDLTPPAKEKKNIVPLEPKHFEDVLDPLSAVLALTHGRGGNPCTRRLSIFDGKVRFDLVFTPAGQKRIESRSKSGQPDIAFVCHVTYEAIAGQKRKKKSSSDWMSNGPVEVALRPVPSANLFVPYSVTIPTFAGPATVVTDRVDIVTHGRTQIALTK